MKTSMKFLMCLLIVLAFAVSTSCKKDSLEDAVLPQTIEGEQGDSGTNGQNGEDGEQGESGTSGTDGQDGAQGENGADGANGTDGQDGAQGENGADGANGTDGQDGTQGENGADGADGQDGADGADGAQGETGADGADGTNGADGNANVITSSWIPINFETNFFGTVFEIDKNEFPSNVRDDYAILVFVKGLNFANAVYPLPITVGNSTFEYALLSDNSLRVFFKAAEGSTATAPLDASLRYVLLESTSTAGKSESINGLQEMKNAGIDTGDYYAIMDYLAMDY